MVEPIDIETVREWMTESWCIFAMRSSTESPESPLRWEVNCDGLHRIALGGKTLYRGPSLESALGWWEVGENKYEKSNPCSP